MPAKNLPWRIHIYHPERIDGDRPSHCSWFIGLSWHLTIRHQNWEWLAIYFHYYGVCGSFTESRHILPFLRFMSFWLESIRPYQKQKRCFFVYQFIKQFWRKLWVAYPFTNHASAEETLPLLSLDSAISAACPHLELVGEVTTSSIHRILGVFQMWRITGIYPVNPGFQ